MNPQQKASQFEHGTIFQAFLNTGGYHRWHGPVDVVIKQGRHSSGSILFGNSPSRCLGPFSAREHPASRRFDGDTGIDLHQGQDCCCRSGCFIQLSNHGGRGLGVGKLGGTTIRGAG
uniref:Phosphatidylserine decarboxylase n=1 Tax=Coccidioides posadasii RMSCC 3488 TaxID=454284 RepID=A0A0J6FRV8_COCPO|nr:hypothetical protein CPAG_08454 [Coccidioides posadasii RMSCC 3488]